MEFSGSLDTKRRVAVRRVTKANGLDDELLDIEATEATYNVSEEGVQEGERVLAGEYNGVRAFMTNKLDGGKIRKWSDLKLTGTLRIIMQEEFNGLPMASIRMNACDDNGRLKHILLEYELPLNFKFDPALSATFSAVQTHLQGEYLGFLFMNSSDRDSFNRALESIQLQLRASKQKIEQLKEDAMAHMYEDFQHQVSEQIDAAALFNETKTEREKE